MENDTPDSIEHFSLDTLEFEKTLQVYVRFLKTDLSLPILLSSRPGDDLLFLQNRFSEIRHARNLIEKGKRLRFDNIIDITVYLDRLRIPSTYCEGNELLEILQTLRGITSLHRSLISLGFPLGPLDSYLHRLFILPDLEKHLSAILEPDGTIKDSASPNLRRIRDTIRRQRNHIQKRLEDLCRRTDIRSILQEDYFTERNGRYVLPVQSNFKRKIPGIQHGRSDTGTTAYIEPLDLVEEGNLLSEALDEEGQEVHRILKDTADQIRTHLDIIHVSLQTVGELDLVYSLGEYAWEYESTIPEVVASGDLILRGMRHPLLVNKLGKNKVVANDLILPKESSGLVITGPNTGGKTVVLKCAGLSCLLALSGLPLLCEEGTSIPLLGGVLADIGDDQSLEQSLSTFSAHVGRMKKYLSISRKLYEQQGYRPLVILDELGAGTDPDEGAALGRALVEELIDCNTWVLVATHIGHLKIFGYTHPSLMTGGMLFDSENLAPTYQMSLDSVGESHGIEIGERLGLPVKVIERARFLLATNPNEAAVVIHRLTEEERRLRHLREDIEKIRNDIVQQRAELTRRLEQTVKEEKKILNEARDTAQRKLKAAKNRLLHIEEYIKKKEEKLSKGIDEREKDLIEREKQIAWMEREADHRLVILDDLIHRFPNFAHEILKPATHTLEEIRKKQEPEWKKILESINKEEQSLSSDFGMNKAKVTISEDIRPGWRDIRPGDIIRVEDLAIPVTVESLVEKKRRLIILMGDMRSEIPFNRVLARVGQTQPQTTTSTFRLSQHYRSNLKPEINLIGCRLDEMEKDLQRYLDESLLSGHQQVRIIHGHGAGILRNGVHRILKDHPQVVKFYEAPPNEGGAGATIAVLKG